jgi:hypothetical protein
MLVTQAPFRTFRQPDMEAQLDRKLALGVHKSAGLRCARMSRSNRSRSSIWTYERHSNIDARVCWGHLMLVTPDRGLGSKCDYQRDALATGIVRGRYDGDLSEIYESL